MPEISRFFGIIICMYWEDHNPPHFHAYYNEFEATYSIENFQLLQGKMEKKQERLIMA